MTKDVKPIPFGVAKWDGTKWTPFLSGADDSVSVNSVVYWSGTIYASGYFTSSADSATFSFAKWSGTKWIPLGTDYGSYNLITCDSSGNLYAKASFNTASNVPFCFGKWDVSTSTWIPLGTDYSSVNVNAIVCDLSGNLYAGGLLDGTNSSVAKWNGKIWSQLGTLNGSTIFTLAFDSLGNLYAGGMLSADGVNAFGVAKWDSVKLKWNFVGGKGLDMFVSTLAFDSSGNLYAGGYIMKIADGIPANNIARWDGSTWSAIGSGTGSTINSLSYSSAKLLNTGGGFTTKLLYVGGVFTTAGGKSSNYIAKLIFPPPPGAPTAVTAVRGDTKATVSFTQPVPNGEFPLTSFEVTSSPEGIKATGTSSPIAVTRLTNGKSYTFTVKATNAIGPFGPASAASIIPVIPATVPDAPTKVIATPGNGQASIAFTAPFNEGSAITGYTVRSDPSGILKTGTASPIIVSGLTNGAAYTFSVTATNALGISEPSDASVSVIPAIPITAIGVITGTVKVDSVLTAGAVTPVGAAVKYQWMRCGTAAAITGDSIGENKNTYTAVDIDAGKFIKVQVTGIGGYSGIKLSAATTAVPTPLSGLAISGTVGVGQILTAMPSQSTATATYQWSSCATDVGETYANIAGATANTYTPTLAVVAKYLKVTATGIGSYSGTVTSDPTATAVPTPPTPITAIGTITGTAKVGSELTAGAVTPAGATVYYMWMRCASSTATTGDDLNNYQATYLVDAADVGKFIKVKARGMVNYDGIVTSTATAAVFKPIEIEKISPTSRRDVSIGMEFIAGNVLPAKATFTYQWSYCSESASGTYRNVTSGGTSNTLFYPRSEKYFKVTVTGTGIYSGSVTSEPVYSKAVAITNIGAISGTVSVGSTLTAGILTPVGASATATYEWRSYTSASAATWVVLGAGNTYIIQDTDVTKFIKVAVTGTGDYINSAISAATIAVPTPITVLPTIGGTAKVGQILTATATPLVATVTYQWQSAAISGGPYSNIVGAIAKAYTLKATDVNKFIRIVVTGTVSYSGTVESSETAAVSPILVTGIAAITGTAQTGSVLTAGAVTPVGATVNYQWMRCAAATDATGASIGENKNTYTAVADDAGKFIKVQVTGIGGYSGIKLSAATTAVLPAPLTAIGTISGTVSVGSKLTAGALTPTAASATAIYQWESFSGATGPWTSIGDSSGTYTIKNDNIGMLIRVKATASGYTGEKTSLATKAVPTPIMVPRIGGTATVGQMLTAKANPNDATVSYQWKSAVTSGGSPSNISGATLITYTLKASDADKYITVFTTGIGSYSGTLQSLETVVSPISVAGIGVITGTVKVGSVLTAGAVEPRVATVKYQWTSCTVGGEYKNIDGATLRTYTVGAAEIAKFIKVVVTGTGGYGGTKTSEATTAVPLVPLTAIGAITGTAKVDYILTAGVLTPLGATVKYQWKRCSTAAIDDTGVNIGTDQNTYAVVDGDACQFIKVEVTGNVNYFGTKLSTATTAVPRPITAPTIDGIATVGQILTATAKPTEAAVSYQWKRCDTSADGDTGVSITAAIAQKYTLVAADVNKFIRVSATGIGNYSGTTLSAATAAVSPISVTNIAITGTAQIGSVLTADAVIPSAATVTYQWTSCTSAGGEYKNIDGAKARTYTVGATELSKFIKVVATGTGGYGGSATSVATTAVAPMPLTTIGAISGTAKVGSELTAGAVTPAGAAFDYQWMRCAAATDATGAPIGENKNTYTVTAADATKYIRVQAIGKACYAGTVTSTATAAVPTPLSGLAISGTVRVDQILTANATPAGATVTYQWQSGPTGGPYSNIIGATAKTYTPTLAVVAKYLKVTATGTESYSGTVTSDPTATVVTAPVTGIGAIIGNAKVGSLLTAGTVTPAGATVTYDWQTAPAASGTWTSTGITAETYTVTAGVKYIRVVATGTDNYPGSATSASITTNVISITSIGNIIDTSPWTSVAVGSVITAGPVTPAGATVTYDWQKGSDYKTFISTGITTNTYTVMAEDAGKFLRVVATGTGSYIGTESSQPGNVATPITAISAIRCMYSSRDGLETFHVGETTPQVLVTYQWSLCDTRDGIYADIPEARGMMYRQKATEVGKYIKVTVKGDLDYSSSGTVTSAAYGPLTYNPRITAIGAITGTAKVDSVLTAGALTPAGATVTYDWQTAPSTFETWTSTGIITNTYKVLAGDEAKYIRVVATGTEEVIFLYNERSTATSTVLGPVATLIDSIGDITGAEFKVGIPLTAGAVLPGTATVTYQWSSCATAVGGTYADIAGATTKTYTPTFAVAAKYLKVTATGSVSYSGSMTSNPTAKAITAPITAISAITDKAKVGLFLTAGAVTPAGATVNYQWKRCETAAVSDIGMNIGTDQATYLVGDGDACKFIKVEVTGNGNYFGTKLSAATTAVPTRITAIGDITGTPAVGSTLTAGEVVPGTATVIYQWSSCATAVGGTYADIAGATAKAYSPAVAVAAKYLKVTATGTGLYSGTAESVPTGIAVTAPVTAIGTITGTAKVGLVLTAGAVTPAGATVIYQWKRFNTAAASDIGTNIGTDLATYLVEPADASKFIKVEVTGNGSYYGTKLSAATAVAFATAPSFTLQPSSSSVMAGDPASFRVTVTGTPTPTCLWQFSTDGAVTWTDLANDANHSGVTTTTMTVINTTSAISRYQFRCMATNCMSSVSSNAAILRVESYDTDLAGTDDFATDEKWSAPTMSTSKRGLLTFTDDSLEYTVSSPSSENFVLREWTANVGSYSKNWEVQVNVHLAGTELLNGQYANLNLIVVNAADATNSFASGMDNMNNMCVAIDRYNDGLQTVNNFEGDLNSYYTGNNTGLLENDATSTDAALRISFNCDTKELSSWYATNINDAVLVWTLLQKVNIASGEDYDWGMTDNSTFAVFLLGGAGGGTNIAPVSVSAGNAYFSNFLTSYYLVIDLSGGSDAVSYPVSYLSALPDPIPDEYRKTKLAMRKIPKGTFTMGSPADELGRDSRETQHQVTLTKDFYIGVFEVTQKQWELVMGNWPSYFNNIDVREVRPVETVSYDDIRGSTAGAEWPSNSNVDADSFMGKLRQKTGIDAFDLPTEAQWEYACRANTSTALNNGTNLVSTDQDMNMGLVGRYGYNGGSSESQGVGLDGATAKVGSYLPNEYGLYDMHGNVCEWSLDWLDVNAYSSTAVTDPPGQASGTYRVFRGGSLADYAENCRSAYRYGSMPTMRLNSSGFRLLMTVP